MCMKVLKASQSRVCNVDGPRVPATMAIITLMSSSHHVIDFAGFSSMSLLN